MCNFMIGRYIGLHSASTRARANARSDHSSTLPPAAMLSGSVKRLRKILPRNQAREHEKLVVAQ